MRNISDRQILGTGGAWAFAEATVFFILPDFLILPAVVARPRLAKWLVLSALVGSLLGSLVLLCVARAFPEQARTAITALPFTTDAMFTAVTGRTDDVTAVVTQPISGVPAKVWVWTAATQGVALLPFFAVMMAARVLRFAAVVLVGELLAWSCGDFLRRHARVVLVVYSAVFLVALAGIAELK